MKKNKTFYFALITLTAIFVAICICLEIAASKSTIITSALSAVISCLACNEEDNDIVVCWKAFGLLVNYRIS